MAFEPTPVHRAREQVESQLSEAILSAEFREGDKLPTETELAEMFDVSRTMVREALRTLVARGLIDKTPGAGGGSFVTSVDHERLGLSVEGSIETTLRFGNIDYREINQVRRMLEIPSVREAALNRSDLDIKTLKGNIELQKATTVTDSEAASLDTSFHIAIAEASNNRLLVSLVSALHRVLRRLLFLQLSVEEGKMFVEQHIGITKGVVEGDEAAACEAMKVHLDYLDRLQVWHQRT